MFHKIPFVDYLVNTIALRKAKIVHNFGLSEFNRVKPEYAYFKLIQGQ